MNGDKSPLRTYEDAKRASYEVCRQQMVFELNYLVAQNNHQQIWLGTVLKYEAAQSQASLLLSGNRNLPVQKAAILDSLNLKTTIGSTFEELAYLCRRRRAPVREALTPRYEVFLAGPMASASRYKETRELMLQMSRAIEENTNLRVYFAGAEIEAHKDFDLADIAYEKNLEILIASSYFVLFCPRPIRKPSSIWVEAGMALMKNIPSVYFVRKPEQLPYILRQAVNGRAASAKYFTNPNEPLTWIARHGEDAFKVAAP